MLPRDRRYLLGISGGRDSVALLYALRDAGLGNLVLCHLNHSLRGEDADTDADFVRKLAQQFDLPCEITRVDVIAEAKKNRQSVELAARHARHVFFSQCAQLHACEEVLLAHHADDQAETIFFNLLRGSGGLKGMLFSSTHEIDGLELLFLRPLLSITRAEIDQYLSKNGITYREDASNAEPTATRNRMRNEALPLLNEIMGREIRPALLRAAAISELRDASLRESLHDLLLEDPQGRLFLPNLAELSPALQRIALHDYLKKSEIPELSHNLLERCISLITDQSIAKINLPSGKFLRRKEKRLFIT